MLYSQRLQTSISKGGTGSRTNSWGDRFMKAVSVQTAYSLKPPTKLLRESLPGVIAKLGFLYYS